MRNITKGLFALALLAASPAAADEPIFVMRPAIGSGTAGVIPQTAFSGSPGTGTQTPTVPGTPTTPSNNGFVFQSKDFIDGRSGFDEQLTSTYNTSAKAYNPVGVRVIPPPINGLQK
jgi:hypothetical protein